MEQRHEPGALGFEDFYRQHYRAVVGLAFVLTGHSGAAEDIAQEAFLATHQRWDRVAGYDKPAAFVRRVAANLAVSRRRKLVNESRALGFLGAARPPALGPTSAETAHFWDAVRKLAPRQAQAVALHYLEDRPTAEIAEILECS